MYQILCEDTRYELLMCCRRVGNGLSFGGRNDGDLVLEDRVRRHTGPDSNLLISVQIVDL